MKTKIYLRIFPIKIISIFFICFLIITIGVIVSFIKLSNPIYAMPINEKYSNYKCKNDRLSSYAILEDYKINLCINDDYSNKFVVDDFDPESKALRVESWKPYKEFLIKYFTKGKAAETEGISAEDSRDLDSILKKYESTRSSEDKKILKKIQIEFSGEKINGIVSLLSRTLDSLDAKPLLVLDFLGEYDNKLWLIRFSQEQTDYEKNLKTITEFTKNISINIDRNDTLSLLNLKDNIPLAKIPQNIKNPDWWQGYNPNDPYNVNFKNSCDVQRFSGSFKLNGSNDLGEAAVGNVVACGPLSKFWGPVNYTAGSQGIGASEYMWQCVEYSMRWMRLAYNESPYLLSGLGEARKIKDEYPQGSTGRHLIKVANGSANQGPNAGDVLAFGTSGDGHTGVVKESYINSFGTGYIVMVHQNSDNAGIEKVYINNWFLDNANGWLHDPASDDPSIAENLGLSDFGPKTIKTADGTIHTFSRTNNNHIVHKWLNYYGWAGYFEDLGGNITSSPKIIAIGNDVHIFAKDVNNHLVHKWYNSSGWSSFWEDLGGPITSAPDVILINNSDIHVFAKGSGNNVVHKWYNSTGWSTFFEDLGGNITSTPSVIKMGNDIHIFAKDTSNTLTHKWYNYTGWSTFWENLGGTLGSAPAAAATDSNTIHIFSRGINNDLVHKYYVPSGWSGWESLQGTLAKTPFVLSPSSSEIYVFSMNSQNNIMYRLANSSGWSGWINLGGALSSMPNAISNTPGTVHLFARDYVNNLVHTYKTSSISWTNWENLGMY